MGAIRAALQKLIEAGPWSGTATDLLARLAHIVGPDVAGRPSWPKNPRALAALLRKLAPELLAAGIAVRFERAVDPSRQRIIFIGALAEATAEPSEVPARAPSDLLDELYRRAIDLTFDGGELRYRGPLGALTPSLRRDIESQRAALLARLTEPADPAARRVVIEAALRDAVARLDVLHRDGLVAGLRRLRSVPAWQVALAARATELDLAARAFAAGGDGTEAGFRAALATYESLCRQGLEALSRYDRRPGFALGCPRCRGPATTRYRDGPLCDRCRAGVS